MMSIPDISSNKEQVPISCVNALNTAKPDPLVYSGVRMPQKDVDLNTNTDYMVCCDCTDNCQVLFCWSSILPKFYELYVIPYRKKNFTGI